MTLQGKVIEYECESGETIYVKPLSEFLRIQLARKAEKKYPYPDKTPYEKELSSDVAAIPGMKLPAEQNEDYRKLCREQDALRSWWQYNQEIVLAIEPKSDTRENLIIKYKDELTLIRDVLEEDMPDDAWEATLLMCVVKGDIDRRNIVMITHQRALLTEAEAREGLTIFRTVLQRQATSRDTGQQESSDFDETQEPVQSEHDLIRRNGSSEAMVTTA